jgi:hypothetical protein
MNCCIAAATSWLLLSVLLLPVTPICESASITEPVNPPPGGGGCDTSELVLVVSGRALLVLLVESSWASQLFILEMLLIVMSLTPWVDWKVNPT